MLPKLLSMTIPSILKSDGSLWGMGKMKSWRQLGDGSTNRSKNPKQIVSSGVIKIGAGWKHSAFVKSDGSLWTMGNNDYGQLGTGDFNSSLFL